MDIHKKHNYFVKIQRGDPNYIDVCFPKNIFLNKNSLEVSFLLLHETILVVSNELKMKKEITLPEYCHRPFILKEIIKEALSRNMHHSLVDRSLWSSLRESEDKEKESRILESIYKYWLDEEIDEDLSQDISLINEEFVFEHIIS